MLKERSLGLLFLDEQAMLLRALEGELPGSQRRRDQNGDAGTSGAHFR